MEPSDEPAAGREAAEDGERARLARAAAGDPAAVEELLGQHLDGLRAFVRLRMGRLVRSREETVDVVQSICREVLGDLDRFEYRGAGAFRHWLYTRAENKLRDRGRFWRRERRDPAREVAGTLDPGEEVGALAGAASLVTPSQHATAKEELERLEAAFAELPADYREVILLARVVGLTHAEIAERIGRSTSATWTLLSRALARLSTLLERSDGD